MSELETVLTTNLFVVTRGERQEVLRNLLCLPGTLSAKAINNALLPLAILPMGFDLIADVRRVAPRNSFGPHSTSVGDWGGVRRLEAAYRERFEFPVCANGPSCTRVSDACKEWWYRSDDWTLDVLAERWQARRAPMEFLWGYYLQMDDGRLRAWMQEYGLERPFSTFSLVDSAIHWIRENRDEAAWRWLFRRVAIPTGFGEGFVPRRHDEAPFSWEDRIVDLVGDHFATDKWLPDHPRVMAILEDESLMTRYVKRWRVRNDPSRFIAGTPHFPDVYEQYARLVRD